MRTRGIPLAVAWSIAFVAAGAPTVAPDHRYHSPIRIDGDATLGLPAEISGVVRGDGSAANPYVIEAWILSPGLLRGDATLSALHLANTRKHVVIQDLVVAPVAPPTLVAAHEVLVSVSNAENVTLRNLHLPEVARGNLVEVSGRHLTVSSTVFDTKPNNLAFGLVVGVGSEDVRVEDNRFVDSGRGLAITPGVRTLVVRHNEFRGNTAAMEVRWQGLAPIEQGLLVEANTFAGNGHRNVDEACGNQQADWPSGAIVWLEKIPLASVVRGNNFVDNAPWSLCQWDGMAGPNSVDARGNWFGTAAGPSVVDSPVAAGTTNAVTGPFDVSSWLTAPARHAPSP